MTSAPGTATSSTARLRFRRPVDTVLPAWPVLVLLWGMPVWWALGLLAFVGVILSVPMIALMLQRRSVIVVPGVLPWIVFVLWTIPSILMLESTVQSLLFLVQFAQAASVGVIMLYLVNARASLPIRRVLAGLTFMWVFVIAGGYLGLLWPDTTLTYTVGRLLPGALRDTEYLSGLLFPPFAELQIPYGATEAFVRPSAPYAYTNGWGAAMALLTPVVVGAALERRTVGALAWLSVGILAMIPPAIATSNRGLFIGLATAVAYVLVRLVLRRNWIPVFLVGVGASAVGILLAASGVMELIVARQDAVDTTEGRGDLYVETFERTILSPLFGYGGPRQSFTSEISVGTQGMIWDVMFSFGFVGLALFLGFLLGAVGRSWAAPNLSALWLHSSLIAALVLSVFYGLDRHLTTIGIVATLLLRERYRPGSRYWTPTGAGRAD